MNKRRSRTDKRCRNRRHGHFRKKSHERERASTHAARTMANIDKEDGYDALGRPIAETQREQDGDLPSVAGTGFEQPAYRPNTITARECWTLAAFARADGKPIGEPSE